MKNVKVKKAKALIKKLKSSTGERGDIGIPLSFEKPGVFETEIHQVKKYEDHGVVLQKKEKVVHLKRIKGGHPKKHEYTFNEQTGHYRLNSKVRKYTLKLYTYGHVPMRVEFVDKD